MRRVVVVMALSVLAGCGGDDSGGTLDELGQAACRDLRAGLSIFQVVQGGIDAGLSRGDVAASLTLGTERHCPEFQDDWRATTFYEEWS